MGLLAAGLGFSHRCVIERDANAGTLDTWSNPVAPSWTTHLADQPCLARQLTLRDKRLGAEGSITIEDPDTLEDLRLYVPWGTDVTASDRVASVSVQGASLLEGPLTIVTVLRQAGPVGPSHLELVLARQA